MTDWLRGKKLDIPEFHSKKIKLTDFNEWFFISLPLLKLLADVYAHGLCMIKTNMGLLLDYLIEWSSM